MHRKKMKFTVNICCMLLVGVFMAQQTSSVEEEEPKMEEMEPSSAPYRAIDATDGEYGSTEFFCRHCGAPIAYPEDYMWAPSGDMDTSKLSYVQKQPQLGSQGRLFAFKNPAGIEHRVALFRAVSNVREDAAPQFAESYFKKYSWVPIFCSCGRQMGWKFIHLDDTPPAADSDSKASSVRKKDEDAGGKTGTSATSQIRVVPYHYAEEEERLKSLNRICLTHPMGWWNVRYCHKEEVIQFHREPDGTVDPKWSLGKYRAQAVERTSFNNVPRGYYYSYFYTQGQICHETNKGRQTEAQFLCCPTRSSDVKPTILSVQEPSVCKYVVRICVPDLCEKPAPSPTPSHTQGRQVSSVEKDGHVSYFYGVWWDQLMGNRDPELLWMEDLGWVNTIQI
eukprot:gb/GECG01014487.1/.p1 GENE.gb/GECG01014487.1/~~gb/GECG01014487.1/.p1  ORF type:complete len:393 (+),score=44.34 gb/GECG01014487.1/:1-1179(+)